MNSISKAIIILRWKSNTQEEILSRKLTPKCDVTEQRTAVKFVLAPKINFWDGRFAVLTYKWSVGYESYAIQVVHFSWKRLPNTPIHDLMNVSWSHAAGTKCTFDIATFSNQFKFPTRKKIKQNIRNPAKSSVPIDLMTGKRPFYWRV